MYFFRLHLKSRASAAWQKQNHVTFRYLKWYFHMDKSILYWVVIWACRMRMVKCQQLACLIIFLTADTDRAICTITFVKELISVCYDTVCVWELGCTSACWATDGSPLPQAYKCPENTDVCECVVSGFLCMWEENGTLYFCWCLQNTLAHFVSLCSLSLAATSLPLSFSRPFPCFSSSYIYKSQY